MGKELTTKDYWSQAWEGKRLPIVANPEHDIRKVLNKILPKSDRFTLIEVGCAIGGWMAYFNKEFSYKVSGIEYVEHAAVTTRENMKLQGIEAEILNEDFFTTEVAAGSYDVVFSAGFIEHFEDTERTVNRISRLSRQYVVTMVPNTYGLNGLISKTVRPKVFRGHKKINKGLLKSVHERSGFSTLFCDYVGGVQFIMPAKNTDFFKRNPFLARIINLPFWIFNYISKALNKYANVCLNTELFSTKLMYIGKKAS